jgi:hypothetical protein
MILDLIIIAHLRAKSTFEHTFSLWASLFSDQYFYSGVQWLYSRPTLKYAALTFFPQLIIHKISYRFTLRNKNSWKSIGKEIEKTTASIIFLVLLIFCFVTVKKGVPLHAMDAPGVRGGIALTHSQPRHKMGVSGQHHAPAALYPRGKDPRYPLDRMLGGPQSRSGRRD